MKYVDIIIKVLRVVFYFTMSEYFYWELEIYDMKKREINSKIFRFDKLQKRERETILVYILNEFISYKIIFGMNAYNKKQFVT